MALEVRFQPAFSTPRPRTPERIPPKRFEARLGYLSASRVAEGTRLTAPGRASFLEKHREMKNNTLPQAAPVAVEKSDSPRQGNPLPGSQFIIKWAGPPVHERTMVQTLPEICSIWREFIANRDCFDGSKESLVVLAVNIQRHLIGWHLVSTGNANETSCSPREVLRAALMLDAHGIVLVHNHPTGVLIVSRPDELATRSIASACVQVGVRLLDHVIVNSEGTEAVSIRTERGACFTDLRAAEVETRPQALPSSANHESLENDMFRAAMLEVPAEKMLVPLPRGKHWVAAPVDAFLILAQTIRGMTKEAWVSEWNERGGLQRHHKRVQSFKIRFTHKIEVSADDFQQLQAAALEVGHTPKELIAAKAWQVSYKVPYSKSIGSSPVLDHGKILQFPTR